MHLSLHGQASGVIHLVVVLEGHGNRICQQGDQFFVVAVFFPSAKSAVFVMAEIAPIRVFCPFCDLTSWVFMEVESWLQIEGFTFGARKPLPFSGRGYLSSLALSFSSPIFSDNRLLKIAARPSRRGGEVFSLTTNSCASSFKRLSRGIASVLSSLPAETRSAD